MQDGKEEGASLQATLNTLASEILALKACQLITANHLASGGVVERERFVNNIREFAKHMAGLNSPGGLSTLTANSMNEMADLIAAGGAADARP